MKLFFIAALITAPFVKSIAQERSSAFSLSAGPDIILGGYKNAFSSGFGINAAYHFATKKRGVPQVNLGYNSWMNKFNSKGNVSLLTLQFGYRGFFKNNKLHINTRVGAGYTSFKDNSTDFVHFNYVLGLGYLLQLKNGGGIDFNMDMNQSFGNRTSRSFAMPSVGYVFTIK
jgi:hypothetical protein